MIDFHTIKTKLPSDGTPLYYCPVDSVRRVDKKFGFEFLDYLAETHGIPMFVTPDYTFFTSDKSKISLIVDKFENYEWNVFSYSTIEKNIAQNIPIKIFCHYEEKDDAIEFKLLFSEFIKTKDLKKYTIGIGDLYINVI